MRLGVEDPLVEGEEGVGGEDEVEVLERLRQPEALHRVVLQRRVLVHVLQAHVAGLHLRAELAFCLWMALFQSLQPCN